jgi:small subunit ribosomal protein S16
MLKIRLSRFGSNRKPTYRLTIAEHTKDAHGNVLEYLGSYNPRTNPKQLQLEVERIKFWLSKGAQPSATVHNMLVSQGVLTGKKVQAWRPKKKAEADKPAATPAQSAAAPEKPTEEKKEEVVVAEEKTA